MRIGVARIWQETNTFSPVCTTLEQFRLNGMHFGNDVFAHLDQSPELNGALAAARSCGDDVELIPIMSAMAWPGGRLTKEAFEEVAVGFFGELDRCGELDGLFVSLHGALSVEGCDDVESELLSRIRQRRGGTLPIAISLDMHANMTGRMMSLSDVAVGYHTCPHLDVEDTGRRAMEILIEVVAARVHPTMAWRKVPMVVPADRHNHVDGPLHELVCEIERIERMPQVLSCSIFAVQPWLDVEELGWTVLVITDGHSELAQELADHLAEQCWQRRGLFMVEKLSPKEAVKRAMDTPGRPVVISDSADSTNSGAPGNSTWLFQEMMDLGITETVFLTMVAPAAANDAHRAGVGGTIDAEFGREPGNPYSRPVKVRAQVVSLHDGPIRLSGHLGKNLIVTMGKTAVLTVGSITIIVSEFAGPGHVPPEFFRQLGLDISDAKIIVAKSPVGFRAAYEPIAAGIVLCEAPGPACSDLSSLSFQRRPKPLYPFERDLEWSVLEGAR